MGGSFRGKGLYPDGAPDDWDWAEERLVLVASFEKGSDEEGGEGEGDSSAPAERSVGCEGPESDPDGCGFS